MKIAIIGTGISGLAAAHRLQDRAELTLFEAGSQPGGQVHTVIPESERGLHSIDTGFLDREGASVRQALSADVPMAALAAAAYRVAPGRPAGRGSANPAADPFVTLAGWRG